MRMMSETRDYDSARSKPVHHAMQVSLCNRTSSTSCFISLSLYLSKLSSRPSMATGLRETGKTAQ